MSQPHEANEGGSSAGAIPEKHLGLGYWMPPPPARLDSSSGSISEKKNENAPVSVSAAASSSAGQNDSGIPISVEDDEDEVVIPGKRKKRCTSMVWKYFSRKVEEVESDGKKYEQLWGYCDFPKCKAKFRAESNYGTNQFRHHLKSAHRLVKGQLQLTAEKDHGKNVTNIQPFRDALYYKTAFIRLKAANRRKYESITPSENEWGMAATVFQCLEIFYELTELLSGTKYPTANLFYGGFCEIRELLCNWKNHRNPTIKEMAIAMSTKFEKYWSTSSMSLAVAAFFDPRYKKKVIEYYMKKFDGDYYQVQLDELLSVVRKLFHFYSASKPAATSSKVADRPPQFGVRRNSELNKFLYSQSDENESNELDLYMSEALLQQDSFDILAYWKNKTDKYPTLSLIARDLMAIQVSTVASESAFSGAGRVIDPYRNRLDPEIVQALVCTKDWINATRKYPKCIPYIVADFTSKESMFVDPSAPLNDEEDETESDPDKMDDEAEL